MRKAPVRNTEEVAKEMGQLTQEKKAKMQDKETENFRLTFRLPTRNCRGIF